MAASSAAVARSLTPLTLPVGPTAVSVEVHPVVLFTICDAYLRRNVGQERVIGTLLGYVKDGIVHIKNCYAVPHSETAEVALDISHFNTLYELHQKVSPREVMVGWFSTGKGVSGSDALLQDFYGSKCSNPIHLTVDTTLTGEHMGIAAYVSRALTLGDRQLATEFQEVPCTVDATQTERVGVDVLERDEFVDKAPGDLDALDLSIRKLRELLDTAYKYVDDVVEGRKPGSAVLGRLLADTVAAVPELDRDEFERLYNDGVQDVLIVMYLASLVRAHLSLADKLGTMALPLL